MADHTGTLVLWYYNTKCDELRQSCTAVMTSNTSGLTAAHCLREGEIPDEIPSLRLASTWNGVGWTSAWVTSVRYHPSRDLAAFQLDRALPVRTGPSTLKTTGYKRQIAHPNHETLAYAVAYGSLTDPATKSNICNAGTVGCAAHPRFQQVMLSSTLDAAGPYLVFVDNGYQGITNGDSGSGVFLPILPNTGQGGAYPVVSIMDKKGGFNTEDGGIAFGGRGIVLRQVWTWIQDNQDMIFGT